jgi:uncharacterized protein YyaL (SSP411 family)
MRDMQSPEGGYYSSLDADSEGQEGKFYVWHKDAVAELLEKDEYAVFAHYYGLNRAANFDGLWHLQVVEKTTDKAVNSLLEKARNKLLQQRSTRIHPHCDDKILVSWNALAIKGMATAADTLAVDRYVSSAEQALIFIHDNMYRNGQLFASYRDGKAHLNAYLDDYAFLIDAILTFLQCRWQKQWLDLAINLGETLLELYLDKQHGGFFFTSTEHEALIHRSKYFMDDALPSGNGVAAHALYKLSQLTGDPRYHQAAASVLQTSWSHVIKHPSACSTMLYALAESLAPSKKIIIFTDPSTHGWQAEIKANTSPFDSVMALPGNNAELSGLLGKYNTDRLPVAYICDGQTCQNPMFDLDSILATLHNRQQRDSITET